MGSHVRPFFLPFVRSCTVYKPRARNAPREERPRLREPRKINTGNIEEKSAVGRKYYRPALIKSRLSNLKAVIVLNHLRLIVR